MNEQHNIEIEIKSLLGSREKADELVEKMQIADKDFKIVGRHKQLNHYFEPKQNEQAGHPESEGLSNLYKNIAPLIKEDSVRRKFEEIAKRALGFSVRTRQADAERLLVVKASIDDTTSSNGTARLEFEANIEGLTLDELDRLVIDSGFQYQAKWSRERASYLFKDLEVSIDKNAGYGYLAEFEKVIQDPALAEAAKSEVRKVMGELGAEELSQERLERMFAYYNANWQDYYGTDKVFTIE